MIGKLTMLDWRKLMTWLKDGIFNANPIFLGDYDHGTYLAISFTTADTSYIFSWGNALSNYKAMWIDGAPLSLNPSAANGVTIGSDKSDPGTNNFGITGAIRLAKSTAPPTNSSYGFLYTASDGSLHYKGTAGTDTKLANA